MTEYERYYEIIRKIPKGRVATYGQIAGLAGRPRHARRVGYALAGLPEGHAIPWHRVINAKGVVSARAIPGCESEQVVLLKKEGIRFDKYLRISLPRFQWQPRLS